MPALTLDLLPDRLGVARLEPTESVPAWARGGGGFTTMTRTARELSLVCADGAIPEGVPAERGFRCLRVRGPLDFSLVGILASLAHPLAEAGVSIFAVSSYDTDHVLVRETDLERALEALLSAGFVVETESA